MGLTPKIYIFDDIGPAPASIWDGWSFKKADLPYPRDDEHAGPARSNFSIYEKDRPPRHPTKGYRRAHKNCRLGSR